MKLPITEKWINQVKNMTRNHVRLMFVKKTSLTNFARSFGYITSYGSNINRLKAPVMLLRYNCKKMHSQTRRPDRILEIRKRSHFPGWSARLLFTIIWILFTTFSMFHWQKKQDLQVGGFYLQTYSQHSPKMRKTRFLKIQTEKIS